MEVFIVPIYSMLSLRHLYSSLLTWYVVPEKVFSCSDCIINTLLDDGGAEVVFS